MALPYRIKRKNESKLMAISPNYDELEKAILDRFEGALAKQPDNKQYKNYLTVLKRFSDRLKNVNPNHHGRLIRNSC